MPSTKKTYPAILRYAENLHKFLTYQLDGNCFCHHTNDFFPKQNSDTLNVLVVGTYLKFLQNKEELICFRPYLEGLM